MRLHTQDGTKTRKFRPHNQTAETVGFYHREREVANTVRVMPWLQWRLDYDPTTTYRTRLLPIRRKQKMIMSICHRSCIAVESNANRNFDHFHGSRMRRRIVVIS